MFGDMESVERQAEPLLPLDQRPNAETGAADADEQDLNHLKKLQAKNTALDSINMLKIAEHINEDSSEARSPQGRAAADADQLDKAEKDGGPHATVSPSRSRQSDADLKKATPRHLKSKDSQP